MSFDLCAADPAFLAPPWRLPPAPHDPRARSLVAEHEGWSVRAFAWNTPEHQLFAREGMLHVQLWSVGQRASVLSPSRLTGGALELWARGERLRACCWRGLAEQAAQRALTLPPPQLLDFYLGGLVLAPSMGAGVRARRGPARCSA